ncbi:ECF transporter S component [Petroclostridium sp. X23]|uniref:ECF transporter S component n=1 Tax=Petroclostridium sp. X23 TaxID=3045146 RepID=UPI0024AD3BD1|nr:ECF transporter S component [Petroclostridium sp. X23]WHH60072.1 ECF transporter S component [Petroclostridium sp. X23]
MKKLSTKQLVLSGLLLAFGLLMPFLTAQIPSVGSRLLPMHIPVLLCGFICGWPYGLIIGFILPVFRSMLFGMPPMFPTAVAMAFELATYGCMSGLLYKLLPKNNASTFATLILSMVCGRIVWGGVSLFLYGLSKTAFTWELFMAGAFLNAIPGIVIQIIIIPIVVIALSRAKLIESVN